MRRPDAVVVVDTEIPAIIAEVAVGTAPFDLVVDTSRNVVYVSNSGSGSISVLDTSTPERPVSIDLIAGSDIP